MSSAYMIFLVAIIAIGIAVICLLVRSTGHRPLKIFGSLRIKQGTALPKGYELPNYFKLDTNGNVDTARRWPGWDGWYLVIMPERSGIPVKMMRASLMTGLYGLDGIDDYDALPTGLSSFEAIEYLCLAATEEVSAGTAREESHLCHYYLPKHTDLSMKHQELDVVATAPKSQDDPTLVTLGHVKGAWPRYEFEFVNRDAGISCLVNYEAKEILWWIDIRNVFSYFSTFGRFDGTVTLEKRAETGSSTQQKEDFPISGAGVFEHGFARKPFNFDCLWLPIRFLQRFFRSWKPIRYHYELVIGDGNHQGGFMHARGFGILLRNQGAFYVDGSYIPVRNVGIEYLDDSEHDTEAVEVRGNARAKAPKKWKVTAQAGEETLEYIAIRQGPAAAVGNAMSFYFFSYEGSLSGKAIKGRGYGELVRL